ncbi:MAG: FAD-dependent thymidylate synthase [Candidatus Cloacimonadota bacterium]|nr:FAD-dependent thymidylate synthase [Candidatus Cloacimonadota bacterium]
MKTILAGYNIEAEKIKEIEGLVTPEVISAAYARISRSKKSVTELREKSRIEVKKARKSNESIIFDMGHSSIAEHAVFNFDILGISRYMSEWLQKSRLASFTEKSQRYVTLKGDFVIPAEIKNSKLKEEYIHTVNQLTNLYVILYNKAKDSLSINDFDGSKKLLQGRAKEDARYILPLSTETQMGMTINARSIENLLKRLDKSNLEEAHRIKESLEKQVKKIAPSLIRYTKSDEFTKKRISLPEIRMDENSAQVKLISITNNAEVKIIEQYFLQEKGILPSQNKAVIDSLKNEDKIEIFSNIFAGMKSYHTLPKPFEIVEVEYELTMSSSCFAQLKRHRMSTIIRSKYNPDFGYVIPPLIENLYLNSQIDEMMKKVEKMYYKLEAKKEGLGNYIMTNSHKLRVYFKANLREIFHFVRLRSDSHAQWEIRQLSDEMVAQIKFNLPIIGKYFVGKNEFNKQKENENYEKT